MQVAGSIQRPLLKEDQDTLHKGPGDPEKWSNGNGMKFNKGKKRKAEPCGWERNAVRSSVA